MKALFSPKQFILAAKYEKETFKWYEINAYL